MSSLLHYFNSPHSGGHGKCYPNDWFQALKESLPLALKAADRNLLIFPRLFRARTVVRPFAVVLKPQCGWRRQNQNEHILTALLSQEHKPCWQNKNFTRLVLCSDNGLLLFSATGRYRLLVIPQGNELNHFHRMPEIFLKPKTPVQRFQDVFADFLIADLHESSEKQCAKLRHNSMSANTSRAECKL